MNIGIDNSFNRPRAKKVFNKYFLYGVLLTLIGVNILFFPDLLNHKDFKLHDMSYLLPNAEKEKEKVILHKENENENKSVDSVEVSKPTEEVETNEAVNNNITKEQTNTDSISYSFYLFILLCIVSLAFGIFIYNNYAIIKTIFRAKESKNLGIKDNLNSGYELLQDY